MNWLQKIIIIIWGGLVAFKFANIPQYIVYEGKEYDVNTETAKEISIDILTKHNNYGAIIPSIIIFTIIATVLFLLCNKIKISNLNKKTFLIALTAISIIYILLLLFGVEYNNTVWLFNYSYYYYPDMLYYSIFYILLVCITIFFRKRKY